MGSILISSILTGLLFLVFLFLLLTGLRKRRKNALFISFVFLFLSLGTGIWTGYNVAGKTYNKVKNVKFNNPFKARSGEEIYSALFGAPEQNCVTVVNKTD